MNADSEAYKRIGEQWIVELKVTPPRLWKLEARDRAFQYWTKAARAQASVLAPPREVPVGYA